MTSASRYRTAALVCVATVWLTWNGTSLVGCIIDCHKFVIWHSNTPEVQSVEYKPYYAFDYLLTFDPSPDPQAEDVMGFQMRYLDDTYTPCSGYNEMHWALQGFIGAESNDDFIQLNALRYTCKANP